MNRREALKAAALLPFIIQPMLGANNQKARKIIKPKRLKPGDTIAVIAPASGVSEATFDEGLQNLADLGFRTVVGKYARGRRGFLAGTDRERLYDLHWAFKSKKNSGVWCIRGGYGTSRILPYVNYNLIRANPKVLVGFSDITALHLAIYQKAGLITFHGPNAASNFTDYTKKHLLNTLVNPTKKFEIKLPEPPGDADPELYKANVIRAGKARGELIGGNLSLLIALTGTPFGLKNVKGKILFIEDVNESPYRVDRMLTQLRQSINMRSLAGVAVGVFTRGEPETEAPSQSLLDVLQDRLGDLKIPVIHGLSFGHIRRNFTIPLGVKAEIDTSKSTLTLLEKAVR